ncbi:MAG: hypothetical protein HKN21_02085 [Candidatus Eisenbacteria bacterium]|uniref:DUF2282 domain-containing protein n=1 Tax=Eiseniibacteriota bacterium TaxID=2212470 RepID=A0A7Y2H1D8_UNCEI|nr:hypothetical protein [Candidatus Eisenbacteria bacterium]
MKRILAISLALTFLVALPAAHMVFAKGHVPDNKAQVCHKGKTLVVGTAAVEGHMRHGDCMLPANDPDNVFFKGDPCPNTDEDGDGRCDLD